MRGTGLQGIHQGRLRGCTRRDQAATPSAYLVERNFRPAAPDRLYVADITQHRTGEGWFYLAVVLDCFSRRVVGWAMADHIRSELVVDALQMAIWNRRPPPAPSITATTARPTPAGRSATDCGRQGCSARWATSGTSSTTPSRKASSRPCRPSARPLELADPRGPVPGRVRVHRGLLQPRRRHSTLGYLSPADFEQQHKAGRHTETAA
jgi:putative transposase